jgi:hypothetical protein
MVRDGAEAMAAPAGSLSRVNSGKRSRSPEPDQCRFAAQQHFFVTPFGDLALPGRVQELGMRMTTSVSANLRIVGLHADQSDCSSARQPQSVAAANRHPVRTGS